MPTSHEDVIVSPIFVQRNMKELVKLTDYFIQQHPEMASYTPDEKCEMYLRCAPQWADARFLAQKLAEWEFEGKIMFPNASAMVDIRDKASHHLNLHRTVHLNEDKLLRDVRVVRVLVESTDQLGVPVTDWVEYKALVDLENYMRFRGRSYAAATSLPKDKY